MTVKTLAATADVGFMSTIDFLARWEVLEEITRKGFPYIRELLRISHGFTAPQQPMVIAALQYYLDQTFQLVDTSETDRALLAQTVFEAYSLTGGKNPERGVLISRERLAAGIFTVYDEDFALRLRESPIWQHPAVAYWTTVSANDDDTVALSLTPVQSVVQPAYSESQPKWQSMPDPAVPENRQSQAMADEFGIHRPRQRQPWDPLPFVPPMPTFWEAQRRHGVPSQSQPPYGPLGGCGDRPTEPYTNPTYGTTRPSTPLTLGFVFTDQEKVRFHAMWTNLITEIDQAADIEDILKLQADRDPIWTDWVMHHVQHQIGFNPQEITFPAYLREVDNSRPTSFELEILFPEGAVKCRLTNPHHPANPFQGQLHIPYPIGTAFAVRIRSSSWNLIEITPLKPTGYNP